MSDDFFSNFEKGNDDGDGEDSDKGFLNPTYLSKKEPGHMMLEIVSIEQRKHAKKDEWTDGKPFVLGLLRVVNKVQGQDNVREGDIVSVFLPMYGQTDTRRKHAMRELAEFAAAVQDKSPSIYADNPRGVLEVTEDDGEEFQGKYLEFKTKPPKNGYHNFQFFLREDGDVDLAEDAEAAAE
jgi:hypothetical protein